MTQVLSTNAQNALCEAEYPGPCVPWNPFCTGDCQNRFGPNFVTSKCVEKNHETVCVCFYKSDKPCPQPKIH